MANKNEDKVDKSDTSQMPSNVEDKSEPTTSAYQIKGASIEQFTKVSDFQGVSSIFSYDF